MYKKYCMCFVVVAALHTLSSSAVTMVTGRSLHSPLYGTHMAPLLTAVAHTSGPILELGCGDYSTTLLHALCSSNQRQILSAETDYEWMKLFLDLENEWHTFVYVPVFEVEPARSELWNSIGEDIHWSVVLVDHKPAKRRVCDIQRLRTHVDVFVVHDTEEPYYEYEPVLTTFKYYYVYKRYWTTTTLVSDTIDVASWFE